MKVRYNPVVGVVMIVLGVLGLGLGIALASTTGEFNFSQVFGPLFTVYGILVLSRTYFEFDATTGTIVSKALIGPVTRRFGGAVGGQLFVMGNKIVAMRADGTTKKVPVAKYLANTREWQSVVATISGSTTGPAAR